jgi:UDP-glucose:(heptosyl)LPS alpha-1,3-glucosyltransferase
MKLAFCIFKYFPFGGLQGDFLRIALECQQRGHQITVYTREWDGAIPDGFNVIIVKVNAFTNYGKAKAFANKVQMLLKNSPAERVIGFNRMAGLDVYFAGDNCLAETFAAKKTFLRRLNPRYSSYLKQERIIFAPGSKTQILLLTERQRREYIKHYGTENERFHLLPPGIPEDRTRPLNADLIRQTIRTQMNTVQGDIILIQVGSGFITKGVDRSIRAIAALPENVRQKTRLWVVGKDSPTRFIKLANQLHISEKISFLGGRNDVPQLLLAADLMIHPAINESAGNVLLEALAMGLPVLCSAACGYAGYIQQSGAGAVAQEPFSQSEFNKLLINLLAENLTVLGEHGLQFAATTDFYGRHNIAADIIEKRQ